MSNIINHMHQDFYYKLINSVFLSDNLNNFINMKVKRKKGIIVNSAKTLSCVNSSFSESLREIFLYD